MLPSLSMPRVHVAYFAVLDQWGGVEPIAWRICEADGTLVHNWAPGLEPDDRLPLDRGGYSEKEDAIAFALGIDRWRAMKRLIVETVKAIDRERRALDRVPVRDPWIASVEPGVLAPRL